MGHLEPSACWAALVRRGDHFEPAQVGPMSRASGLCGAPCWPILRPLLALCWPVPALCWSVLCRRKKTSKIGRPQSTRSCCEFSPAGRRPRKGGERRKGGTPPAASSARRGLTVPVEDSTKSRVSRRDAGARQTAAEVEETKQDKLILRPCCSHAGPMLP